MQYWSLIDLDSIDLRASDAKWFLYSLAERHSLNRRQNCAAKKEGQKMSDKKRGEKCTKVEKKNKRKEERKKAAAAVLLDNYANR